MQTRCVVVLLRSLQTDTAPQGHPLPSHSRGSLSQRLLRRAFKCLVCGAVLLLGAEAVLRLVEHVSPAPNAITSD